ncbi:hypothetical protein L1987_44017 [Smallanthus sonchifolius]|uniref:Uncharacterized protein n=1 Tax=Smallanthus sonchifolius TaxID=185202 RepID=A0ACB9GN87_9ASTR|nr:hypothetical protein L1987_44017 [Smallanthus sonchifolius]
MAEGVQIFEESKGSYVITPSIGAKFRRFSCLPDDIALKNWNSYHQIDFTVVTGSGFAGLFFPPESNGSGGVDMSDGDGDGGAMEKSGSLGVE